MVKLKLIDFKLNILSHEIVIMYSYIEHTFTNFQLLETFDASFIHIISTECLGINII
jgi:hypothetical protein